MNPRILVAFAAGAMAAAGVVFFAMRPIAHVVRVVTVAPMTASAPPSASPPVEVVPASLPDAQSADDLVRVQGHQAAAPAVHYKKPSAMPIPAAEKKWPVDKPEPVEIAANLPPADQTGTASRQDSMSVARTVSPPPAPAAVSETPRVTRPVRTPNRVVLQTGMLITVRIGESISGEQARVGDPFFATLDGPLVIDGWIIAAQGSRAEGRVVLSNHSELGLQLTAINTTDRQHLGIGTATFLKRVPQWDGHDTATVGGVAALGAIIGAAADGGKGAGIGAAVGGAAAAGGVMAARERDAAIPVETRVSFRVDQPLTITEHLD